MAVWVNTTSVPCRPVFKKLPASWVV